MKPSQVFAVFVKIRCLTSCFQILKQLLKNWIWKSCKFHANINHQDDILVMRSYVLQQRSLNITDHFFFLLIDTAIQQLEERFNSNPSLHTYKALGNVLLTGICRETTTDLLMYKEIDWANLEIQIEIFRRKRPIKSLVEAVAILKDMAPELRGECNEVEKLERLLLVSPASSTEAKRSFSALRRLKTWLRITMTQVCLNSLSVCHVHKGVLECVNVNALLDEFISRNERHVSMFEI